MQGPIINAPLNPSTYLSDPFDIANETKATEAQFHAYPKLSLINEDHRASELPGRENEESQNCDNDTCSYNQVYADTLLSRQLQDEESNPLEQTVDALIKKRGLINKRGKSSFNSHCMLNPHKHEESMWIDPSSYDHDTIKRQKHRRFYQTAPH